ncbi:Kelch repeat-containing protein [Brumimicrobium oceani]|uniref:Glucosyl transferase n=1 Tax=Brumimicrobium oceani TaxID=2100725 RepID=A0A2U2XCW8_9FLAO|nr:hypothetical protein [Brumimicrobium oceani]PWH85644.1 hypothetical protein DIT68_08385 [Brumimicrobium oceani]
MKYIFTAILLFLLSYNSKAQGWEDVSGGIDDIVYDMIKFDNELYVGGRFYFGVKSWDGSTWTNYPNLPGIGSILTLSVHNDTLYAGGGSPYQSSQSSVFRLINGGWEQIGGNFNKNPFSSTQQLISYDSLLISGGRFNTIGGVTIKNIASWDGNVWDSMGDGLDSTVLHLEVHEDTLYATGEFMASGSNTNVQNIAKWDGSNWISFDSNIVFSTTGPMKSFQGDLLIGNVWNNISGIEMKGIARWDGTNYSSMGDTIIKKIHEFWEFSNELYIAADIFASPPLILKRTVMKWNGTDWSQIGANFNQWIVCLEDYDNMLYCGGQFSAPTSHIGRYNPFLSTNEYKLEDKEIVKVVDLTGREIVEKPNTLLIYIYSDGTTKKVFRVE